MEEFQIKKGGSPLLVSVPHAGTMIPTEIRETLEPEALFLPDTDWFVDKLFGWVAVEGASLVATPWSRYVIDVNRPPDDAPLYAGNTTGLVPKMTFCGFQIYKEGRYPEAEEIARRLKEYWRPYHEALQAQLAEIKARHGYAILLDAHSIRSQLPDVFEGRLPHLNLGTNSGASAVPSLIDQVWQMLDSSNFSAVKDGRFKGGYIVRHYGRPNEGIHAIQLETAQRAYMPEFPPQWDLARARDLVSLLKSLVDLLHRWRPDEPGQ